MRGRVGKWGQWVDIFELNKVIHYIIKKDSQIKRYKWCLQN